MHGMQAQLEIGPASRPIRHGNASAHTLHQGFDNRQADAMTRDLTGGAAATETFKDLLSLAGRHTWSMVPDVHHDHLRIATEAQLDRRISRAVFRGVLHQVGQALTEAF